MLLDSEPIGDHRVKHRTLRCTPLRCVMQDFVVDVHVQSCDFTRPVVTEKAQSLLQSQFPLNVGVLTSNLRGNFPSDPKGQDHAWLRMSRIGYFLLGDTSHFWNHLS